MFVVGTAAGSSLPAANVSAVSPARGEWCFPFLTHLWGAVLVAEPKSRTLFARVGKFPCASGKAAGKDAMLSANVHGCPHSTPAAYAV